MLESRPMSSRHLRVKYNINADIWIIMRASRPRNVADLFQLPSFMRGRGTW